jgi:type II secretory pathway component PulF
LKGLSVYPFIVLLAAIGVSLLITTVYRSLVRMIFSDIDVWFPTAHINAGIWLPGMVLMGLACAWLLIVFVPKLRNWARWRLPGFREAALAQIAAAAALLLRSGATLQASLVLLQKTEGNSPAGREIARWIGLHQQGVATWDSFTAESRVFPPLFGGSLRKAERILPPVFSARAKFTRRVRIRKSMCCFTRRCQSRCCSWAA